MEKRFNIRVYGILIKDRKEVLISKEKRFGKSFTKFPGGGLEWGEGLIDCLKREFKEELGIDITIEKHLYTCDFFQESAFRKGDQLVSVYYKVNSQQIQQIENGFKALDLEINESNHFYWLPLENLTEDDVTYPIDKLIVKNYLELSL
ncbi:MAG: NUDIX domain-containing protein [Bacteroidetes bacterium]|nr:MAG: NUDIX domain-containing protein [Bacteroidota bacterium]MBL1146041.1 NUDIX domain-containing protein [Bacteroidota bacterium]NOG58835.1 NUDIX domain-containing protein [Bacteroidota bacterium]